jgi:hypothetical protein
MKIKIALIDTGIDKNIFITFPVNIQHFSLENDKMVENYKKPTESHGNKCLQEILKQNVSLDILDFNVTDDDGNLQIVGIISSIQKAIDERVDIINLSLGICEYSSSLFEVCEEAISNNIAIISANSHSDDISYPAAFKNVVGVKVNQKQMKKIEKIDDTTVTVRLEEHIVEKDGTAFDFASTSLACAYFSGVLAKELNNTPIFDKFVLLKENFGIRISDTMEWIEPFTPISKKIFKRIKNKKVAVVLLPPHKKSEMNDFLRLENIIAYWDHEDRKFYRFNITTVKEEVTNFDSILIINTSSYEVILSSDLEKRFSDFELIYLGKFKRPFENLLYSHQEFFSENISSLEKPVVLILGIGENLNKFDIQKNLMQNFIKDKFMPKAITYNPEGALYGFDVFQYPNQVIFPDIVCSINHYMSCLEVYDEVEVFVIDVGGGIFFINNQNKQNFGKLSESYFHAANVDIVILCITNGVDLNDLEFAFQKFQNFGVKHIFLMLSHNTFDFSTLETQDGIKTYQLDSAIYQLSLKNLKENLKEEIFTLEEVKKNQLYQKILEKVT